MQDSELVSLNVEASSAPDRSEVWLLEEAAFGFGLLHLSSGAFRHFVHLA